ncbi:hypothetical protein G8O24_21560 [Bradyrhizobium sp. INPA01-394B]|uniref:Uncharacterized protein n=1 Tax=Bradyrhizobium campsiandrae TaxID=1729892 RepID=A0ABR7U5D1_9BRAD|nr:hypothetical protein [Bradyrhizobium campsiandrae]MBC9879932.1 hypothetical protein [Bradyrhizobium campsiandrae]MBC9978617.1 hypothetical protein [Bradyrhizobium campsiandrae]
MTFTQALIHRWRTGLNSIFGIRRPIPHLQAVFDDHDRGVWYVIDGPRKISTGVTLDPPQAARRQLWKYRINKARRIRSLLKRLISAR